MIPGTRFPPSFLLFLLWTLQCGLVLFLAAINPNHYTTIDSHLYLESASRLLGGEGYRIRQNNVLIWNGIYPMGYSSLIAMVSFMTSLNVLWASKVLNLIASAIWLLSLRKWFGESKALFMGTLLLLGSFLKLWAHTWSEPLFLMVLFSWFYHFVRNMTKPGQPAFRDFLILFLLGTLLMLIRYAGIFIIMLTVLAGIYSALKHTSLRAFFFLMLSLLWLICFGGYLWLNYWHTGSYYGGERLDDTFRFLPVTLLFAKGLLNELLIIRDFVPGKSDVLFLVATFLQIFLTARLSLNLRKTDHQIAGTTESWVRYAAGTAIAYLLFLFVLRNISPFDPPGYRLLAPFTFLAVWALLLYLSEYAISRYSKLLFAVLVLASWFQLVPDKDLKSKFQSLLNLI
ncbi:hypothetical protein DYBT9275_00123 [Dyadobacter sp. CECT 9275]|uniref:Uncharacterized protein n=1 Tax=Dyadobacter helix TaxID=2822344 RepID=A0A916NAL5_9BACT|nr:hypothetical protein [Dyadobacter sp. CECT 9275]CAG4988618.1 hypothetical protein DYBT9275_00123 [Dyadobacter sp. CECT 9275]